jgi:unsaturated rhamnogalacturonyl hydrolase
MRKNAVKITVYLALLLVSACSRNEKCETDGSAWAIKMAASEMTRYPEAWMIENARAPHWSYTYGCEAKAMLDLWEYTGDTIYFNYAKGYADSLLTEEGQIKTYRMDKFNIDNINPGKILFRLYAATGDARYKIAIDTLAAQMAIHPRTSAGGFWHKQIYPHQMWLDGLYMASPFLAEYAGMFDKPEFFDEAVNQIKLIYKYCYDEKTGLFYHGWDESREQKWADKTTGLSPNFWSRSIGWYAMAIVDVLDFLPENHPGRNDLLMIAGKLAEGIGRWQDDATGVWYQVTNMGAREGNYLESSASCMFVYFLYKGLNNLYLNPQYIAVAGKGFDGIIKQFIKEEKDGACTITNCCAVSGLGGEKRYRDGSFEYYISEPVIENDPKSVAPFIYAAIARAIFTQ